MDKSIVIVIAIIQLVSANSDSFIQCRDIKFCSCTEKKEQYMKLKCIKPININQLTFQKLSNSSHIIILDLSNTGIHELYPKTFPFENLERLNLDRNVIQRIHNGTFANLNNLRKLILSHNKLKSISNNIFDGLNMLETLKLNNNLLEIIRIEIFETLISLKVLDISDNPLVCNCDNEWLLHASFNISPAVLYCNCKTRDFNTLLKNACNDIGQHEKKELDENYSVTISPNENQVVFSGDSMEFVCNLRINSSISNSKPQLQFTRKVPISNNTIYGTYDGEKYNSVYKIENLLTEHSGEWKCVYYDLIASINVEVIPINTDFCNYDVSEQNIQPITSGEKIVKSPCDLLNNNLNIENKNNSIYFATHCVLNSWRINKCSYSNSVTQILQQFSKMNLTNDPASMIESMNYFINFTSTKIQFMHDIEDVHLLLTTIENYLRFAIDSSEFRLEVLSAFELIFQLPANILEKAQQQFNIFARFIDDFERTIRNSTPLSFQKKYITLQTFSSPNDSSKLICSFFQLKENTVLNCSPKNEHNSFETMIESSIYISAVTMHYLYINNIKIYITSFQDGRFFSNGKLNVDSPFVFGINSLDPIYSNLLLPDPLTIILKYYSPEEKPVLLSWNSNSTEWIKNCKLISESESIGLKFSCNKFGYFSLFTEKYRTHFVDNNIQKKIITNCLHPIIYIGSHITITCLLLSGVTYCYCYSYLQMSRNMKHSLANTWFSTSLLLFIISHGILETEYIFLCQVIGLSINYLALSTLFWMTVTIMDIHKRTQRFIPKISTSPSEDLHTDEIIKKSVVGIYLVGWGIPTIACIIIGVLNMGNYAGANYCFLEPGPGLNTFLIPSGLVFAFLLIMCLVVKCKMSKNQSNPSICTQAIEIELLDQITMTDIGIAACNSVRSVTTPSSQIQDTGNSIITHLKAFVVTLGLYAATMSFAMTNVIVSQNSFIQKNGFYGFMYFINSTLLGIFVLYFYCFMHHDVRMCWRYIISGKNILHKKKLSSHILFNGLLPAVKNTTRSLQLRELSLNQSNNNSTEENSTIDQRVIDKELAKDDSKFLHKNENIDSNLIHQRQQNGDEYNTLNPVDAVFYNQYQSIVARNFFKRQRKKMTNNTLPMRRCRSGDSSPVCQLFLNKGHVDDDIKNSTTSKRSIFLRPCEISIDDEPEMHPLTYDEPDLMAGEEGKTGTESEATFTIPEYAEIAELDNHFEYNKNSTKKQCVKRKDFMTVDILVDNWYVNNTETASDMNSEPTYNYACISEDQENSNASPMYTSVIPDIVSSSSITDPHEYKTNTFRNNQCVAEIKPCSNRRYKINRYRNAKLGSYSDNEDMTNSISYTNNDNLEVNNKCRKVTDKRCGRLKKVSSFEMGQNKCPDAKNENNK